ncbi:MAG TPA: ATP-dependent helicase, partial [Phycisphaerales bacterium]|nr:ATP-dependent helicase [Phycisphaerales bacterium]
GLLDGVTTVRAPEALRQTMPRFVRRWIGALEDRGSSGAWRLMLRLSEPIVVGELRDLQAPGDDIVWNLSFHLQSLDNESVVIDAEDIWALRTESATVEGRRVEQPQDLILKELGRASRLDKRIEGALGDAHPIGVELTTRQAYEFLRESRPLLVEQGIAVEAPQWWESPSARIGARLRLSAPDLPGSEGAASPSSAASAQLGLQALVGYHWQIAIGESSLSLEEFERLAAQRAPLVRIDGRWVEVRPEDVQAALSFIKENPGGEMRVGDALWLAFRADPARTGLPILGVDATGWVEQFLSATTEPQRMPMLTPPRGFKGELRPYQLRGLSWMVFLDRLGLGPCLADDMGLGKTIQLLALMLHERERAAEAGAPGPAPTLLVVPMSIVSNWKREADRFAPTLRVLVHHGVERTGGASFCDAALRSDLVITTYSLAHRDRESLELVPWCRVVLDEAQNVKNPGAKQSQAVRALQAGRRVALTGTPLENRLSELWSIMDFCNPGFLGGLGEFRRHFSVPIERYRDRDRGRQLRGLVRPFILRRLKTDPTVISDLPEKVETKEFCRLTAEQASLYESCVKRLLTEVDEAEGIRRRGVVLTALIRLKQICNHPAQLAQEDDPEHGGAPSPGRSGKCVRLLELLDEVIASGEKALVFTQFRQMGHLLATMLRREFDREILFFHGGTPQAQRQNMIDAFQKTGGTSPVLVLSLKAGGVGLNLTAASHVFHFDRWWNPAVENQATDRAFRIGQTRTVNVHKFIVSGTLEDRIDQMIESKIALAQDVIGSGEDWLTELSTAQLRDMLSLRPEAMTDD